MLCLEEGAKYWTGNSMWMAFVGVETKKDTHVQYISYDCSAKWL
jgi:hypothetical protein